ncbi:MAG TPA: PAS domain S-box protein [Candidatus Acidoferrum sp.]|nr:PAS domain S-box protein [Candidatus Acidoferrum sp.]
MAELSGIADPAALLAGLFAHVPVGFQIYTADGYSVLTNPKFREIFGGEPPPGYNALRDEQAAQLGVIDLIRRAFAGETVTIPAFWYDPRDVRHVHVAEGRRVAIEITAFPLRGRDGRVSHVAMVHKDVTADLLAQAERGALTARLEMMLDRMPIGCLLYDAEFRFAYWNKAAERIFGYRFEEVRGRHPFGLITPTAAQPRVEGIFRELAAGRREIDAIAENMTKDGRTILCEWHDMPLFGAENRFTGILAMCQDVTERHATEERLRQSEKMNAVGQLTGGVAHDFNNLLTVVIGNLDLAVDRVQPELQPAIEGALRAAERGAALVRQMLAFSRRQTLISETLDLNHVVAGMEQMLRRTLGEDVEIEMRLSSSLWVALADRAQVESALLNLAINARDAMAAGGKLTIETDNAHLDADYAAHNTEVSPGDYVALAVSDTGIGMTAEVLQHAFEPFFTTKEVGKGTGLGLSMIYGFAKQSQGHVKIYSEAGHGTTVRLYLPRKTTAEERAAAPARAERRSEGGSETILVVEDDADVRAFVSGQLRDLGYRVIEAADGPQVQRILESDEPIDLLFTDVVMPGGMTGRQLAETARTRRPALKAVFTSGYTENSIVHQGKLDRGVSFLAKPFRRQDLAAKVRETLDEPG